MIKEFYIVFLPQFKQYVSLYHVILESIASLVMFNHSVGTHPIHDNYVYTKLCMNAKKSQSKQFQQSYERPTIFSWILVKEDWRIF